MNQAGNDRDSNGNARRWRSGRTVAAAVLAVVLGIVLIAVKLSDDATPHPDTPWEWRSAEVGCMWPGRPNCEPVGEVRTVSEGERLFGDPDCGTIRYYDDLGEAAAFIRAKAYCD